MSVTIEEVTRIAALARLRLAAAEAERMVRDMNTILEHMEALASADIEEPRGGHEPGARVPPPDRAANADALARPPGSFAPDWREGFFVVPRIPAVEGRSDEGAAVEVPGHEDAEPGDRDPLPDTV